MLAGSCLQPAVKNTTLCQDRSAGRRDEEMQRFSFVWAFRGGLLCSEQAFISNAVTANPALGLSRALLGLGAPVWRIRWVGSCVWLTICCGPAPFYPDLMISPVLPKAWLMRQLPSPGLLLWVFQFFSHPPSLEHIPVSLPNFQRSPVTSVPTCPSYQSAARLAPSFAL